MIKFQKHKLSNGLQIIHHYDNSTPLVCLNILYDVGARDEDEKMTGFAHLFEHLMFGGSVNIPSYDEPLQKAGGENNAFTSNDITNYYLTLPAENIEIAFWLESDRMLSLGFSERSLEVQRNVVIEEYKQRYLNQPYGDVWLMLRPMAFKLHPYRWATIGKEIAHIENAGMVDVKSFFKKHYVPSNAIMVVAGNLDFDTSIKLAEKWFGPIESGVKPARNIPVEPIQTEPRFLSIKKPVPVNAIYQVYHMCARTHPDYFATDLLSDVLSRGKSSRFYKTLVRKKKLFSEVDASLSGDIDPGLFIISGKLSPGVSFKEAEAGIREVILELQQAAINDAELNKVKNKTESTIEFSEISILNKAMNLAYSELLGDAGFINDEIRLYREVTSDQIIRIANSMLIENNCSTLYYESEK